MSRIELDRYDRDRVERLRADLAAARAQSLGGLDDNELCRRLGYVEALAEALLRVLDQGEAVDGPQTAPEPLRTSRDW